MKDLILGMVSWLNEELLITILSYWMIAAGVVTFLFLTFAGQKATYGRYTGEALIPDKLIPARLAWCLQEAPSLLIGLYALSAFGPSLSAAQLIANGMFTLHYWNRTLVYPVLINGGKPTPLHLVVAGGVFCTWNGFIQGIWHARYASFAADHVFQPASLAGVVLFATGAVINLHSDSILRNLRLPGESGYKVPRGGLFDFVSGANFFGEILEWTGYALYARTLPALAFAVFTACNIGPRAVHHHQWYKKKFDDYPTDRRALIPFVL